MANERRSRRPLVLAVAAIGTVAVGVGGFFVLQSASTADDSALVRVVVDDRDTSEAFSYATATTTVDVSAALRTAVTMSAPGMSMAADFDVDRASQRYSIDLTMTSDPGTDSSMFGFDDLNFVMIGDPASNITYVSGEIYQSFLDIDTEWVSMTDEQNGGGYDTAELFQPLDMTAMFAGFEPVEVGIETIDGEELKHFTVTMTVADLLARDPDALGGYGSADLSQLDSITFDVWVDEASRLRRVAMDEETPGQRVEIDMRLEHLSEPIEIALPDPTDVTDFETAMQSSVWGDVSVLDD